MVTDQYSHILDDDRKLNAKLLEDAFYQKKSSPGAMEDVSQTPVSAKKESVVSNDDRQLLEKNIRGQK